MVRFGDVLPKGSTSYSTSISEEQDRKPLLSSSNEKTGAEEMRHLQEAAEQVDLIDSQMLLVIAADSVP